MRSACIRDLYYCDVRSGCPDQCQDSLADSAGFRCMLHPDSDVPDEEGKEVSKQGMIARQIIYLSMPIVLSWDLAEAFGWFYFSKAKMVRADGGFDYWSLCYGESDRICK